jgi:hypothetical protein
MHVAGSLCRCEDTSRMRCSQRSAEKTLTSVSGESSWSSTSRGTSAEGAAEEAGRAEGPEEVAVGAGRAMA